MRQILFPVVLFIAACAQTPPAPTPVPVAAAAAPAEAASGTQVVAKQNCHRENKAGTNLFQTVCEQSDLDRQNGLDTIGKLTGAQAAGRGYSH